MNLHSKLTIVIVSFNSGSILLKTLASLLKNPPCKIVIVDNYSTDSTPALIENNFPEVDLIRSEINLGYGRAANIGLRRIHTEYGLLLNPDIFLNLEQLENIFDAVIFDDSRSAIYAPALSKNEKVDEGKIFVDYLVGAFLLFRMRCLNNTGLFDENFFLFYEEKDLELRLIESGFNLVLLSDYYVEHIGSASSTSSQLIKDIRNWHVAWSSLYYYYKHGIMKKRYQGFLLMYRYAIKSIINIDPIKRLKYKARYRGCKAYLYGKSAFDEQGLPRMTYLL